MDTDRNLLFGVLALQAGLLDNNQFAEACTAWGARKDTPLADLLLERGWLTPEDQSHVQYLLERKLRKHEGDAAAGLAAVASAAPLRALADVPDPDVQQTLVNLPPHDQSSPQRPTSSRWPAAQPAAPERYALLQLHAQGGIGRVWRARDEDLGREVALKELRPEQAETPASVARFVEEARVTGQLEHPGIVPVHELAQRPADGHFFYTMRFVKGRTLHDAIKDYHRKRQAGQPGPLDLREQLTAFVAVCNAVAYANSRGVLHRDLKPQNVALGDFGEVLVLDWGLARVLGQDNGAASLAPVTVPPEVAREATLQGQVLGTPSYMPPEQAEGQTQRLGRHSDVYGLGAILYEILTAEPPFTGPSTLDILLKVVSESPVRPRQRVATTPPTLEAVCLKALAKQPDQRYASAKELAQEVERWLADEPVHAYREALPVRLVRWGRRHRTLVAGLAAAVLVALVALAVGLAIVGGLNRRLETANADLTESNNKLETARADAEAKRVEAERERAIAVAVSEFLRRDLLGQADISNQPLLGEQVERDPDIKVVELLDRASQVIEGRFRDQPSTEGAIRQTIGGAYHALGKYEIGQRHLERSLDVLKKSLGPDHLFTLHSKNNLASVYLDRGNYDKAEPLFLEVLQQSEKKLGADHSTTLKIKNNLAGLHKAQGNYDKAELLFLEVLKQHEKKGRPDHPDTLTIKHNLAAVYHDQGNYDKAEPLFLEVSQQQEKQLGADHPSTLTSKLHLAVLYSKQSKYTQAERLCLEVLQQWQKKWGADHPNTLTSKHHLALLYQYLGKYDKAEPLHLEVFQQQEKKLGADHPNTLASKHCLAVLFARQKMYNKAEPLLLEVLQQWQKQLGADHPNTVTCKYDLAALYSDQRQYAQAETLYLEVLQQWQKKQGADHPNTLKLKNSLAGLYRDQGNYDKAEPLFLEVLRQREKNLGSDHPDTVAAKSWLAVLYQEQKKYEKAETLHLEVLRQREKLGADHADTLIAKDNLAALYQLQGKYDQAETLHLEVLQQSEKKLGADHLDTLVAKNNLAALYWKMRKLDRSIPLFQQVLQQSEKSLGAEHPQTLRTLMNLGVNYNAAGRLADAIRCLEDALSRASKRPGSLPAKDLAWASGSLVAAYEESKQFAKAEPLRRAAVAQARMQYGPDDFRTGSALVALGLNLLAQKKHADAEKPLRDCLRILEKAQPDDWRTFATKSMLGGTLLGQKKYDDAEPLLVQGYEGLRQRQAKMPPHARTARLKEALERLVTLYDATGNSDEAANWRKKLDEVNKAAANGKPEK
jgi:tRNA A-37 threonylcarbamoyl transferase component Bud32